jgi:hypothetical protein
MLKKVSDEKVVSHLTGPHSVKIKLRNYESRADYDKDKKDLTEWNKRQLEDD